MVLDWILQGPGGGQPGGSRHEDPGRAPHCEDLRPQTLNHFGRRAETLAIAALLLAYLPEADAGPVTATELVGSEVTWRVTGSKRGAPAPLCSGSGGRAGTSSSASRTNCAREASPYTE